MIRKAAWALTASGLMLSGPALAQAARVAFGSVEAGISTGHPGGGPGRGRWREPGRGDDRGRGHRRGRVREIGLLGDNWSDGGWIYRHNRTAIGNGYFGHGSVEGGRYAYDRGYPYDHYEGDRRQETYEPEPADTPRELRCRTQWTRDDERREQVPVTVCRG